MITVNRRRQRRTGPAYRSLLRNGSALVEVLEHYQEGPGDPLSVVLDALEQGHVPTGGARTQTAAFLEALRDAQERHARSSRLPEDRETLRLIERAQYELRQFDAGAAPSAYAPNRLPAPPPPPPEVRALRERYRPRVEEEYPERPVRPFDPEERVEFGTKPHHFAINAFRRARATHADWVMATSGNATADRDEFEEWAMSLPGAPRRGSPEHYDYLLQKLNEQSAQQTLEPNRLPAGRRLLPGRGR